VAGRVLLQNLLSFSPSTKMHGGAALSQA
jgi:hypothetical protein